MQVKVSPMTCQHGCSELCTACRCCFHNKPVLRRTKWCFYSHTFNTRLRLLSLFFLFFFVFFSFFFSFFPAIRSLSHCPRRPRQAAFLQWRWYAFPLVCVPTLLRVEQRWRLAFPLHLHRRPSITAVAWIAGVDHFLIPNEDVRTALTHELCSCKTRRDETFAKLPTQKTKKTCTNQIFQKCKFDFFFERCCNWTFFFFYIFSITF